MGRFGFYEDEDDDNFTEDKEVFDDEETPHPIPFSTQFTSKWSRALFDSSREVQGRNYDLKSMIIQRNGYDSNPRQQSYPPLSDYWDASTVSVSSMLENQIQQHEERDDLEGIIQMLQVQKMEETYHHLRVQNEIGEKMKTLSDAVAREHKKLDQWDEAYKAKTKKQNNESFLALKTILKADHATAKKIIQAEKAQQKQLEDDARREQEALDDAKRKEDEEKERIRRDAQEKQAAKDKRKAEIEKQLAEKYAEKYAFVTKAKTLMEDLVKQREIIQPFDTCKAVSKRRMNMKRLCRGRVNTISADVQKIQTVSRELIESIKAEKEEDQKNKNMIDRGDPGVSSEMAKGCDYFVDLLASSIMVRIQAEGFNGPRGDGFPLAAFLATVASEIPEFVPIFEAHVYSVCPLAIPFVASLDKNAGEDELMESLGMVKNKEGNFESFERFLQRTEGIVSFMSNTMSSHPSNHLLFGGHGGAIEWLNNFIDLLPPPPEQLPLFTASVLDAFLTGSSNMLANLHSVEFKKHIADTFPDILTRLDEGAIGAPSAHRLKETLKHSFEEFQKDLPPKALPQLYNNGGSAPPPAPPPPPSFGQAQPSVQEKPSGSVSGQTSFSNSAFGNTSTNNNISFGTSTSQNSPFGQNNQSQSPFGQNNQPQPTNNNPFGQSNQPQNTSNNNPFAQNNQSHNTMSDGNNNRESDMMDSNKFGPVKNSFDPSANDASQFNNPANQQTPFGFGTQSNQTTHFGASDPGSNPFGGGANNSSSPFNQNNNQNNSGNSFSQPNPTPFSNFAQQNTTPFGNAGQQNTTPFGNSAQQNTTPFGTSTQQNTTPFGNSTQQNSPFNQTAANSDTGKQKVPCRFFAQGKCRYGDKCRFSHETPGNQGGQGSTNAFGFGNANPSPW